MSLLAFCFASTKAFANEQIIILKNTLPIERTNEVIEIPRKELSQSLSQYLPVVRRQGSLLNSQLIDENRDGKWDKILIEISLQPFGRDTLMLQWVSEKELPLFVNLTNVRLSLRSTNNTPSPEIETYTRQRNFRPSVAVPFFQMEGPGIENDKVAFRSFFDFRNGKDIYGKVKTEPVLEQIGVDGSWHKMHSWGMDILKVGQSLGAGGLAIKEDDLLYRLGDADTAIFTTLYEGPLQAAFRLDFYNWDVGTTKQNGSETIILTKGQYYYQNKINVPLQMFQQLICGIADFGSNELEFKKHNHKFSSLSTYGPQAEGTATNLGLAILFPSKRYLSNATTTSTDSIPNTTYVALKASNKNEITIFFFACWEKSDRRFEAGKAYALYLQQEADKIANPVQTIIQRSRMTMRHN